MNYVVKDSENRILAILDDSIDDIPQNAAPISPELLRVCNTINGPKLYVNGAIVRDDALADQQELDTAYRQKIKEINDWQRSQFNDINFRYPIAEQLSWFLQQAEAVAFANNSNAQTPYLDTLSTNRGKPKNEVAQTVLDKNNAFQVLSAKANGIAQALREQADNALAANDIDTINSITTPQ